MQKRIKRLPNEPSLPIAFVLNSSRDFIYKKALSSLIWTERYSFLRKHFTKFSRALFTCHISIFRCSSLQTERKLECTGLLFGSNENLSNCQIHVNQFCEMGLRE